MAFNTRFLIAQEAWDALDHDSYWLPYKAAPCHVTVLSGFVLCSLQGSVQEKIDMLSNIESVTVFDNLEDLKSFQADNPEVWPNES
jgi:hypothetical protein